MSAASASSACVIFFSIIAVLMSESAAECLPSLRMNRCFLVCPGPSVAEIGQRREGVRDADLPFNAAA